LHVCNFQKEQILFWGFAFFDFIDIFNDQDLLLGCVTAKISFIESGFQGCGKSFWRQLPHNSD